MAVRGLSSGGDKFLPIKIAGSGRYLPGRIVPSSELEARCGLPPGWCERKQGIKKRCWVEDETQSFMGAEAAKEAIADAGMALTDIDLIFNASQTFEQALPEGGTLILRRLGPGDCAIPCRTVTTGCLGFLTALYMSAALIKAGRYRNILIVTAEICSAALDFNKPEVCTLLGDGAAAVVVTPTAAGEDSGIHAIRMETYSESSSASSLAGINKRKTIFNQDLQPQDLVFQYNPKEMQAAGLKYNQKFIARMWPEIKMDQVKLVIPNQASKLTFDYMRLLFPRKNLVCIIDRYGNCGASGHPLALDEALKTGQLERGDRTLLIGMGNGFSLMGIVLTY
jgi:3-oxoacyl-[acyl-carrier-protein] synthase-3